MMSLEKRGFRPSEKPPVQAQRLTKITILRLLDGTQIEGTVHVQPGLRIIDHLNRESEHFIAVTDAAVKFPDEQVNLAFIAVNKAHIVSLHEK